MQAPPPPPTRRRQTWDSSGSVWDNRMMNSGNNKSFNADDGRKEADFRVYGRRVRQNQNVGIADKRRSWGSESVFGIEKKPIQQKKVRSSSFNLSVSHEISKEFGICKEKTVVSRSKSSNVGDFGSGLSDNRLLKPTVDDDEEEEKEEIGPGEEDELVQEEEEEEEEDYKDEEEEKSINVVEIKFPSVEKIEPIAEPKKFQIQDIPANSETIQQQQPILKIHPDPPSNEPDLKIPISTPDSLESSPITQNRMQSLVDLVMWRDISKSAFIFGLGTFLLLSSSFTKDLNFSLVSAISYIALLYLAIIFFYRSILCRGAIEPNDKNIGYIVGEEDAIWLLKLVLPYLNEVLSKLKQLFSGDPATTMKLSVLLFVLARCGSSITTWTLAKLAFFGVFTIPKVCASYSFHLTSFGKFWVRRFKDAWNSCSQKKAVAIAVFTVIWNLSSVMARIWAVFFLIVVVRFYQQSLSEDEVGEQQPSQLDSKQQSEGHHHSNQNQRLMKRSGSTLKRVGPTLKEIAKDKKGL